MKFVISLVLPFALALMLPGLALADTCAACQGVQPVLAAPYVQQVVQPVVQQVVAHQAVAAYGATAAVQQVVAHHGYAGVQQVVVGRQRFFAGRIVAPVAIGVRAPAVVVGGRAAVVAVRAPVVRGRAAVVVRPGVRVIRRR